VILKILTLCIKEDQESQIPPDANGSYLLATHYDLGVADSNEITKLSY